MRDTRTSVARAGVRSLGEVLITAGLVLLLFCVYQLVWTNIEADHAQGKVSDTLRRQWSSQGGNQSPGTIRLSKSDFGKGFSFLHIPRLGRKYSVPVVQGVSLPDLSRGVGHYPSTALPGQVGNFAVAGHRATHGEPFAHLDLVKVGDSLVVETARQLVHLRRRQGADRATERGLGHRAGAGQARAGADPPADHVDDLQPALGLDATADRLRPSPVHAAHGRGAPARVDETPIARHPKGHGCTPGSGGTCRGLWPCG